MQIINIGAAPDDNTGDPIRTAFDKANANFDALQTLADLIYAGQGLQGVPGPASSGYTLLSSYGSLAAMVATIGPTAKLTVGVDVSYALDASLDLGNIDLLPLNGNTITTTGYTLTYNGSTGLWPRAQVFVGSGTVTGLQEAHLKWFATGDGTDEAAKIQAAIRSISTLGGTLYIDTPPVDYAFGTTIVIDRPVRLVSTRPLSFGTTSPTAYAFVGTTFRWTGGFSPMFTITDVAGAYFENLRLDGANAASNGILADRWRRGGYKHIVITGAKNSLRLTTSGIRYSGADVNAHSNSMFNTFEDGYLHTWSIDDTGNALELDGEASANDLSNSCHNLFLRTELEFSNGYGFYGGDGDNNTFVDFRAYRRAGKAGQGAFFSKKFRANYFFHMQSDGGLTADHDAANYPLYSNNFISGYDRENGQPVPTRINGAYLTWSDKNGDSLQFGTATASGFTTYGTSNLNGPIITYSADPNWLIQPTSTAGLKFDIYDPSTTVTGNLYDFQYKAASKFRIANSGSAVFTGQVFAKNVNVTEMGGVPASATDTGNVGELRFTANYIYVCVATNTWKRAAISTW